MVTSHRACACLFGSLLAGLLTISGCGGSELPRPVRVDAKVSSAKDFLKTYIERGELDSGISDLQDLLEAMKTTDPAKSAELLNDLKTLRSLKDDSSAIKAQAKKMSEKL